jgi:hypothetical protein
MSFDFKSLARCWNAANMFKKKSRPTVNRLNKKKINLSQNPDFFSLFFIAGKKNRN